ncbi:MupA/Atu3671 family FMN-dependent luciferase-like monooxygenase [Sinorhizobium meliloti]|uniref:MupA/Atu3671 family FMN-dependent luciferase-like monooxygenase n=1 Tax=Rhizobium meliloti TaxID=382 RepID=UPI000FD87482|nr:MupA/Atu3671 family FMN-dependent luciferase-like monooxygenase [Sinorhizobium meliloti]RVQ56042.1 LLM class flavin-dependent oxidoreductase [Sinorhizobium meliloti]
MPDIEKRIAALDPDRLRLLEKRVRERNLRSSVPGPPETTALLGPEAARGYLPRASVFLFSGDEDATPTARYDLILAIARMADERGFSAVWTPERHYDRFGGLYPSPAVLGAAIAAVTRHIGVRAGSVVLPLHSPMCVAEEWSVVDNLSNGRVGLSLAPGFHPQDFAGRPEVFRDRRELLARGLRELQNIWEGAAVPLHLPDGAPTAIRLHPRPIQKKLPLWLTAAGSELTFVQAGQWGLNILTAMMGQNLEQLTAKITKYRQARATAGLQPEGGTVTVMLHTYVGESEDELRRVAHPALKRYLETHTEFAALKLSQEEKGYLTMLSEADRQAVLDRAVARYRRHRSLVGTPDYCRNMLRALAVAGVDEVACLVDFGVEPHAVMSSLHRLVDLMAPLPATC